MKVLMVLTSHDQLGNTGRKTGFWLEELAAPYYVFKDAGARSSSHRRRAVIRRSIRRATSRTSRPTSPAGSRRMLTPTPSSPATVRLDSVKQEDYDTVFYPGGHGPMWDLAEDKNSIKLLESFLAAGKTFAVVCHSSGALAPCQDPGRQAVRRGQDRDRLHQWRGRRGRIDEGGALPCRGRTDEPRCHLFQGQELGRSHGRRRPADHRPESGLVGPGCQGF